MRIRFSLRTFFLFVTVAGIGLWPITLAISALRISMAVRQLNANGIFVSQYSETQARPYSVSVQKTLTPGEWGSVRTLGDLWTFEVAGAQATSAESLRCLQQSKSTLRRLYVQDCALTVELVRAISECSQLENLVLIDVDYGSPMDDFGALKQLSTVHISGSPNDADLRWLGGQRVRSEVTISSNQVTDELAATLVACQSIHLDLRRTKLTRVGLLRLAKEAHLTTLRFPDVELTEADIADLAAGSVKRLDLAKVTTQASLEPLLHNENINWLHLSINYAPALLDPKIRLNRTQKLRIAFGPLNSRADIPHNPWPDSLSIEGFTSNGSQLTNE